MEWTMIVGWIFWAGVAFGLLVLADHMLAKTINFTVAMIRWPIAVNQDKKTRQHYYDHQDRYFDFRTGQWYFKDPQ